MKRSVALILSHTAILACGFTAGAYTLPILAELPPVPLAELQAREARASYRAVFDPSLPASDWIHWGDGRVALNRDGVSVIGRVSPGPNYKMYLAPEFVANEADFLRVKDRSVQLDDVEIFRDFVVPVPASVDLEQFTTVVIWCESFSQFITAAKYR